MFYNTTTKVKLPYHATLGIERWWDNGSVPIWITAQRQVVPPPATWERVEEVQAFGVSLHPPQKQGTHSTPRSRSHPDTRLTCRKPELRTWHLVALSKQNGLGSWRAAGAQVDRWIWK